VHNSVDFKKAKFEKQDFKIKENDKVVLFLGRITIQKGPEYFVYAAKKALEINPNIKFVFAGDGDMAPFIIEKTTELGIADKVLFTGFLRGDDIDRAYQMADVYVMPSVSEPFGITPLEAMKNDTPVIISKQSGVSEVINHCLKADFWDIDQLANKILSVLRYPELHECLAENGLNEIKKMDWEIPAKKCIEVYNKIGAKNG
jgi:glycosyltransferase involved in cell wall biosynthesis